MGYFLIFFAVIIGIAFLVILIFAHLPSKVMGDVLDVVLAKFPLRSQTRGVSSGRSSDISALPSAGAEEDRN